MQRKYYLYILSYPNYVPFYIGKGVGYRISLYNHPQTLSHNDRLIMVLKDLEEYGLYFNREIYYVSNSELHILALEKSKIQSLSSTGYLTNITYNKHGHSFPKHLEMLNYLLNHCKEYVQPNQTYKTIMNNSIVLGVSEYNQINREIKREERKQRKLSRVQYHIDNFSTTAQWE